MSFGGHVQDMINRIKFNNSMRKSSKVRFTKIKESYKIHYKDMGLTPMHDVKLTKEKLEKIKKSIRKKLRRESQYDTIKAVIVILIFVLLLYYLFLN